MTEERIKCECCGDLFPRSLYDKHWAALSTDATKAWRYVPLDQILRTSRLLDNLERAGYATAGDVLDVEITDLARNVRGVGLLRALEIRQRVFDHVKPFGSQSWLKWVLVNRASAKHEIKETTPALNDTLMTIAALLGVALMVYMLARMVL